MIVTDKMPRVFRHYRHATRSLARVLIAKDLAEAERHQKMIERMRGDRDFAAWAFKNGMVPISGAALIQDAVAAATAVAGYNMTAGKRYQQDTRVRHLKGYGLVGSTNPADSACDLFIGNRYLATARNSRGGANISINANTDLMPVDEVIMSNEFINWLVSTAPTTNQLVFGLDIDYLT